VGTNLFDRESLDPLYSPVINEAILVPAILTLRRLSEAFGSRGVDMSPTAAITF
jgi:hypothetical protein